MITADNVHLVFTHPPLEGTQGAQWKSLQEAFATCARAVLDNTVTCADQQAVLRKLSDAMWASLGCLITRGQA